jgi:hypothetical protein
MNSAHPPFACIKLILILACFNRKIAFGTNASVARRRKKQTINDGRPD